MDYQLHEKARELAQQANISMMQNIYDDVFLYHKPSAIDGAGDVRLVIGDDSAPEGFEISMPKRLSLAWTLEQTKDMIYKRMVTLPILPLKVD